MKGLLNLILVFIACLPLSIKAQWISLKSENSSPEKPQVTLLSDSKTSTIIKVDLSGFEKKEFVENGKSYHSVSLMTDAENTQGGSPDIPYISKVIAIPNNASATVEIIGHSSVKRFQDIHLPPARESWFEGEPQSPLIENAQIYKSNQLYPASYAAVSQPSVFRDFRIVRLAVYPVRYNPADKELEVVQEITVKINYEMNGATNLKRAVKKHIAPSFAPLYRSTIFNYQSVLDREYNGREDGIDVMLCIMPDELYASFLQYADWQHRSGTYIHLTKFSDIGANSSNPDIIKNHISDAYFNWENPPTYILLVGDKQVFPVKYVYYDYTFPNEDYFVEVDGNDYFPEMMIGRFTNQGDYRMRVMINKYLDYERKPYTDNPDWFSQAILCSNNAYQSQVETKRFVADILFNNGHFSHVDTVMSKNPCPANNNFIKNAINSGRSFLNYRGEGWSSGWWANCYPFHTSDVSSLNNGRMLTFVTSIGCGVAMFTADGGNCFGEEWIQLGSLSAPRGAIAFVGPTSNTHTSYNNRIDKGIYTGMFLEEMDTPGQALLRGKLYMYNVFGDVSWVEYHYRIYCILGDPSIRIWKQFPRSINVTHSNEIPIGYSQIEFTVTDSITGLPKRGAEVTVVSEDVYKVDFTDANGNVIIPVTPGIVDTMSVVVNGDGIYPYEGTINIVWADENVAPDGDPVVVDLNGNNDGLLNPNEELQMTFTLKNWGTTTASGVTATLTAKDTSFISIVNAGPISFGDLDPNTSQTGAPFEFRAKENCPVDTSVTVFLIVQSSFSNWKFTYPFDVTGCILNYENSLVDDSGMDNHNYRLDPGETVKLYVAVSNIGQDIAPNVTGILRSSDPFITIIDSLSDFGTILKDSAYMNLTDYFEVTVDSSFQNETQANFNLKLSTSGGLYPYSVNNDFALPNGVPVATDPTGPDGYGYYAYSSDDAFYLESPSFDWVEIKDVGTEIERPGGTGNYTAQVDLPFTFKYYGADYSTISINTDGWAAFGSQDSIAPINEPLPFPDTINCMTAVFWDDLFSSNPAETGQIFYYYDAPNNRFVVQWNDVGHFSDYTNKETFQIILLDPQYYNSPTGDGEFIYQYKSLSEEESCTVGIENENEDIGLTLLYNDNYDLTATQLRSEQAIKFTTHTPTAIITDIQIEEDTQLPSDFSLSQNYPNPFNPSTKIQYTVPSSISGAAKIQLKIYDILGTEIATLVETEHKAGKYEVTFNTRSIGGGLSSGVYFYRIIANYNSPEGQSEFTETKKLVLLK